MSPCVASILLVLVPLSFADSASNEAAPTNDRVAFPKDYRQSYRVIRRSEDAKGNGVTVFWGNEAASRRSASTGAYPYGSILVMEVMRADLDKDGHLQPGAIKFLHVMRKEKGFGESYAGNRAGEWEFVQYAPDGSYLTSPAQSAPCAACHRTKAGAANDYAFESAK